jgi:hypothetical protein
VQLRKRRLLQQIVNHQRDQTGLLVSESRARAHAISINLQKDITDLMSPRLRRAKVSVQEIDPESERKPLKLLLRVIRDLWQLAGEMEVLQTLWTSSLLSLRVLAWFPKIMLPLSLLFGKHLLPARGCK